MEFCSILWGFTDNHVNFRSMNMGGRHSSLKSTGKIRSKRNVLKKFERIDILTKGGRWKPGDKVLGIPKTKAVE